MTVRLDSAEEQTISLQSTVEEIASWVQGDGTDAQRCALADGIREFRFLVSSP